MWSIEFYCYVVYCCLVYFIGIQIRSCSQKLKQLRHWTSTFDSCYRSQAGKVRNRSHLYQGKPAPAQFGMQIEPNCAELKASAWTLHDTGSPPRRWAVLSPSHTRNIMKNHETAWKNNATFFLLPDVSETFLFSKLCTMLTISALLTLWNSLATVELESYDAPEAFA